MIEVWRPGRPEGQRRERPERRPPREAGRRRHERRDAPAPAPVAAGEGAPAEAVAAAAVPAEAAAVPAPQEQRHHRRDRHRDRTDQPERTEGAGRPPQAARGERPDRSQRGGGSDRPPRGERGRDRGGDRPDRDPDLRAKYIKGRNESRGDRRDNRDKAPDPNSPFAKLAALKEQLEGKEPR